MGHEHHHHGSSGNLQVAFFLNLAFTIIEVVGGLWTNSIAILTDSLHDLGDSASLGLAWYFDRLSTRGRNREHTFGYRRYRLLGGLITGVLLAGGLVFMVWHAIERLGSPQSVHAPGMMLLAVIGIVMNGAAVWRTRTGSSLTERLVSWHLLEDTLGWAAVLIGAAIMAFWDVPVLDPLLSLAISGFILWNVARNLRQVMRVFLQATPDSFNIAQFETRVSRLIGVRDTHHLHVWSLDGESHVLTVHVRMAAKTPRDRILAVKREIRAMLNPDEFAHVTVDIELEGEDCIARSDSCDG